MKCFKYIFLVGIISTQLFKAQDVMAAVDEAAYNQKVFELSAILYGVTEIGAKSCKGAGTKIPDSLEKWNTAVNEYMKGETARDGSLLHKQQELNAKLQTQDTSASAGKQVEVYQLGIESLDAGINSISGNGGRISLRQKLMAAINEALEANALEDKNSRKAYAQLNDINFPEAINSAKVACERKKIISECVTDDDGHETCNKKEVSDPVPGCDVAIAELTKLKSGPVTLYGNIYVIGFVPSTELNDKMEAMEKVMKNTVAAIPRSSDANYDWSTAVENGIKLVETTRKESGIKCPSSADNKSFNRSDLDLIVPERNSSGAMPSTVSNGTKSFLSKIGTTDASASVVSAFTDTWNTADMVVGQAGQRAGYFNYVKERVDALLGMDSTYLSHAQEVRKKFADYAGNVSGNLDHGVSVAGNQNGNGSLNPSVVNNTIPAVNGPLAIGQSGSGQVFANSSSTSNPIMRASGKITTDIGKNSGINAIGKVNSASVNGINGIKNSVGPSGTTPNVTPRVSESGTETTSGVKILAKNSSDTSSRKAVKNSRQSNSDKTNTNDVALTKSLDGIFEKLKDSIDSSSFYKTASFGSGNNEFSNIAGFDNPVEDINPAKLKRSDIVFSIPTQSSRNVRARDAKKVASNSKESASSLMDLEIAPRQISGQNFRNMDKYKSNENDSLFEKVTKAYIRNYEELELP